MLGFQVTIQKGRKGERKAGAKYLERIPTGDPQRPWKYIYERPSERGKAVEKPSESVSAKNRLLLSVLESSIDKKKHFSWFQEKIDENEHGDAHLLTQKLIDSDKDTKRRLLALSDDENFEYETFDEEGEIHTMNIRPMSFDSALVMTKVSLSLQDPYSTYIKVMNKTGIDNEEEVKKQREEVLKTFEQENKLFKKKFSPLKVEGKEIPGVYMNKNTGQLFMLGLRNKKFDLPVLDSSLSEEERIFRTIRGMLPTGSMIVHPLKLEDIQNINPSSKDYLEDNQKSSREEIDPEEYKKYRKLYADITDSVIVHKAVSSFGREEHEAFLVLPEGGSRSLPPEQRDFLNAITLYTNGNVPAVKNPDLFDEEKAKSPVSGLYAMPRSSFSPDFLEKKVFKGSWSEVLSPEKHKRCFYTRKPTKKDYEEANRICTALAAAPFGDPKTIYRGMALPLDVIHSLEIGSSFDLGDISSWSTDHEAADEFAESSLYEEGTMDYKEGHDSVVFILDNPKYGSEIKNLSCHWDEQEVLSSGSVRVNKIELDEDYWTVHCEHI